MFETLIEVLGRARHLLYRISGARWHGIDVDVVLHFGFGALIYAWAERRMGGRKAALLLGGLILAKEIADLFLKSELQYIKRPNLPVLLDVLTDILTGIAGGLAVHVFRRLRARSRIPASSPGS